MKEQSSAEHKLARTLLQDPDLARVVAGILTDRGNQYANLMIGHYRSEWISNRGSRAKILSDFSGFLSRDENYRRMRLSGFELVILPPELDEVQVSGIFSVGKFPAVMTKSLTQFVIRVGAVLIRDITLRRQIIVPPGTLIRKILSWWCRPRTMAHTFDPTLTDLRDEYLEALHERKKVKAFWVRIRGYWSILSAIGLQSVVSIGKRIVAYWRSSSI